jgi:hypothetical protein
MRAQELGASGEHAIVIAKISRVASELGLVVNRRWYYACAQRFSTATVSQMSSASGNMEIPEPQEG